MATYQVHDTQSESNVATVGKPVSIARNELCSAKQQLRKDIERMVASFEREHPEVFVSDISVDRRNEWSLAVGHPVIKVTVEVR